MKVALLFAVIILGAGAALAYGCSPDPETPDLFYSDPSSPRISSFLG